MESNPEILRIQLRQAEAVKMDMERRANLGIVSRAEVQQAAAIVGLFRARLEGDRVQFARQKVTAAQQRVEEATVRYRLGSAPGLDVQVATDALQIELARLREAESRATNEAAQKQAN